MEPFSIADWVDVEVNSLVTNWGGVLEIRATMDNPANGGKHNFAVLCAAFPMPMTPFIFTVGIYRSTLYRLPRAWPNPGSSPIELARLLPRPILP
jgi:hypothetical protein